MSEIEQQKDVTLLQLVLPSTVSAESKEASGRMVAEVTKTDGLLNLDVGMRECSLHTTESERPILHPD